MYIHVICSSGEAKFWLEPEIELSRNQNLLRAQLKKLKALFRCIMMNSKAPGKNEQAVEVTNISNNGIWLWVKGKELFMSYKDYPWFKDSPVGKILNVKELSIGHFYWPDLDVDLSIEIIEHPERFPLQVQ